MFKVEPGLVYLLIFVREQCTEQKWAHGSMKILADLQRDLHVFPERRGNVLSHLIFRFVVGAERLYVRGNLRRKYFHFHMQIMQRLCQHNCGKPVWFGNRVGHHFSRLAKRKGTGKGNAAASISIQFFCGVVQIGT